MIRKIWNKLFGKKVELPWPADFAIIMWTEHALTLGVKGNRNKVIIRYLTNKFGNTETKRYTYSEERIFALQEVHKIPIFDKTNKEVFVPIYARILPGEIQYKTR